MLMDKVFNLKIEINQSFLNHLIRNYPYIEIDFRFDKKARFLSINDKNYRLDRNKKYLVNKIFYLEESSWKYLGVPTIRKTIKKFIDGWR